MIAIFMLRFGRMVCRMNAVMDTPLSYDELLETHKTLTFQAGELLKKEDAFGCDTSEFRLFDILREIRELLDAGIHRKGILETPDPDYAPLSLRLEFNRRMKKFMDDMQSEQNKLARSGSF